MGRGKSKEPTPVPGQFAYDAYRIACGATLVKFTEPSKTQRAFAAVEDACRSGELPKHDSGASEG